MRARIDLDGALTGSGPEKRWGADRLYRSQLVFTFPWMGSVGTAGIAPVAPAIAACHRSA